MDLTNKTTLLAVGCSHMAGSEIEGPGYTGRSKINTNKAWAGLLAKHFNLNYINLSVPGGSNEYIQRTIVEFVSNWITEKRDPKKLFVVVGWSTNERMEFTWKGQHYHWANGANPQAFVNTLGGTIHTNGPDFTNWFKALQLYHTDFDFGFYKKIISIITTNTFLKQCGVDHLQVSNCAKIIGDEFVHFGWEGLDQIFPQDSYFEKYNSFIDNYLESHGEHFTDWLHADELVHSLYAKKLIQHIEEKNND